jgi:hypothetical protein
MKNGLLVASAAALALAPLTARAQAAPPGVEAQPWVADRSVGEGVGILAGDFEFHPGVAAEFGFDSNFFQRSSSGEDVLFGGVADSLRLRITPQLSLRTLDRRVDAAGDRARDRRPISFSAYGSVNYNEFIATDGADQQEFSDARNIQGGGGLDLGILPGRAWSGTVGSSYAYVYEPSNQGGLTSNFSRHMIDVHAQVDWKPGGGAFEWQLLRYGTLFSLFDVDVFDRFNNGNHSLTTAGRWKFLPKTAVLYDATFGLYRYGETSTLNDGESLQARMGLSGLLTKRVALMAMGGWASSFYRARAGNLFATNYDDVLANAEVRWYVTSGNEKRREGWANIGASTLTVGYARTFQDGYLADWFQSDRGYAQIGYMLGGMVFTSAEVGTALVSYPDYVVENTAQQAFDEIRLDLRGFAEYRPLTSLGINLSLEFNENFSTTITAPSYTDDFSFSRFRGFVGVRWFM